MESNDIGKILDAFFNQNSYRAILIDGNWGIGKTYQFKKFFDSIDKRRKKNIYYFSIFGVETMDELNTDIYRKLHRFWSFFLFGYKTLSKSINAVIGVQSSSLNVTLGFDYVLDLIKPKKIKKFPVLIFDDVERFSNENFSLFLGLLYKLNLQGARTVCFISSEKLGQNKACYDEYKEKLFDAVYKIEKPSFDIFETTFMKEENLGKKENLLKICDYNIRTLRRSFLLYERINSKFKNSDMIEENKYLILSACCFAIKIVLNNGEVIDNKKKESFQYVALLEDFNEDIANNYISSLSKFNFSKEEKTIPNFVKDVLKVYLYDDFSDLENTLKKDDDSATPMNKSFFLLSDENKQQYITNFMLKLKDGNTELRKKDLEILLDIINYSDFEISDEMIIKFSILFYKNFESDDGLSRKEIEYWCDDFLRTITNEQKYRKAEIVINKIKNEFHMLDLKFFTDQLIKAFANKDYSTLSIFSDKFSSVKNNIDVEIFLKELRNNNFYLPDLSKDITQRDWDFCHSACNIIHLMGFDDEFIDYAHKIVKANQDSKCLKERLEALIYYRLEKRENL